MAPYQSRKFELMIYVAMGMFFAGLLAFALSSNQMEVTFNAGRLATFGLCIGVILATIVCFIIGKYSLHNVSGGTKLAIILMIWQGIALATCAFAFYSNIAIASKPLQVESMTILSKEDGKGMVQHWYGLNVVVDGHGEQIYVCPDAWKNIDINQRNYDVPVSTGFWGYRYTSTPNCN